MFTGRALGQELGDGGAERVHPDDPERCLKATDDFSAIYNPLPAEVVQAQQRSSHDLHHQSFDQARHTEERSRLPFAPRIDGDHSPHWIRELGNTLGNNLAAHYRINALGFTSSLILPARNVSVGVKYFKEFEDRSTYQGYSFQITGSIKF